MSTVYGQLFFGRSDDAVIDESNLAIALNNYSWSDAQPDGKWHYFAEHGLLAFESNQVEDPSGLPKIWIAEVEDPDSGVTTEKNYQKLTPSDYDNIFDSDVSHADLKEFANSVCPFIKVGSIQITCSASNNGGLIYWEQVTVNADGTGIAYWKSNRINKIGVSGEESF